MCRFQSLLARISFTDKRPFRPLFFTCWSLFFWIDASTLFAQQPSSNEIAAKLVAAPLSDLRKAPSEAAHGAVDRSRYIGLVRDRAEKTGLPADIAEAVAYIESGYHPEKIGTVGEIGLMQVRPETAAMLGFQGAADELAVPETNIRYGVTYLAQAWRLAEGDLCRALMKYRAGHGEEHITLRSWEYCSRAKAYLARLKSNPAEKFTEQALLTPNSVEPPRIGDHAKRSKVAVFRKKFRSSEEFWAAHDARIRVLTRQVHAKWKRFAKASASY